MLYPSTCLVSSGRSFSLPNLVTYRCIYLCRVLAQVSCELVPPKPNRPTEGILFFNLELSPMAAPGFEPGRCVSVLKRPNKDAMRARFWSLSVYSTVTLDRGFCCFNRQQELLVRLNRLIERCLRNSRCIDTESLCVVAGEKVRKPTHVGWR